LCMWDVGTSLGIRRTKTGQRASQLAPWRNDSYTWVCWRWNCSQGSKLMLCPVMADLSGYSSQMCQWDFCHLMYIEHHVWPIQTLQHSEGIWYTSCGLSLISHFMCQRKMWEMFLGRKLADLMLYQDSTLLKELRSDLK
jgi:hypothetical protein